MVTVDQFGEAMLALWKAGLLGAFLAVWLGGLFAGCSNHFLWLFLRRSSRWRRFDRAMRKVMP
ncbi:hypothetical protein [Dyella jiangningensis]